METEPNKVEKVEKSSRIMAWSKFLRAVSLLIWSVIGFIILGYAGYYFFLKDTGTGGHSPAARTAPREARVPPVYSDLDKAVAQALEDARSEARTYALTHWINGKGTSAPSRFRFPGMVLRVLDLADQGCQSTL